MKISVAHLVNEKFPPTGRAGKRPTNIRQFSKAIDTDVNSAIRIYDGTSDSIRMTTLENLCNALDCTPNDILVFESNQK